MPTIEYVTGRGDMATGNVVAEFKHGDESFIVIGPVARSRYDIEPPFRVISWADITRFRK